MEGTSSEAIQEWSREIAEEYIREAARISLHSRGIVYGHPELGYPWLSDREIRHCDQSLDPVTVGLDWPLLHVIFHEAALRRSLWDRYGTIYPEQNFIRPFPALSNIWLAIHAQTADPEQQLPIPVEHVQWIDHPISEMIALHRLSVYDDGKRLPEPALIALFLHSTTFEVLLPTLHSHIAWLRRLSVHPHVSISPSNEASCSGPLDLLSSAFKVLLGLHLAPEKLPSFWVLVCSLYGAQWAGLPELLQFTFLQSFFSVIDGGPGSAKSEYLGIKWM